MISNILGLGDVAVGALAYDFSELIAVMEILRREDGVDGVGDQLALDLLRSLLHYINSFRARQT